MARKLVIGDLRVQAVERGGRGRSFTIVWPDGAVHEAANRFLRGYEGSGTQRTYAYLLLDHLRWLEREALVPETVLLQDLRRYMAALGAAWRGPYGQPWRAGRRPFGQSALSAAAACVKGFYLQQALLGVNAGLGAQLQLSRLPSRADRQRAFLGHVQRELPSNPLAPPRQRRRHPKLPPEGARERLLEAVGTARDRLVVTWLADGGSGSASCAGCTWPTCTCARVRHAGSAAPRTCTSATGTGTRTGPRPRPSTRGGQRTAW